ncbi:hypothetical protein DIPPA_33366 [Diplonema papillatum]|nr:hypothetical protein DIPPA_33366 [Diplonema papillatum]
MVVPSAVMEYFLRRSLDPPKVGGAPVFDAAEADVERLRERQRKNKAGFWKKRRPPIVAERDGVEFRVGEVVRYTRNAGVKPPTDTGHIRHVAAEPPVAGLIILGEEPGRLDVLRLHYPRQTFIETDTQKPVVLGPFESTCHVSFLEHADVGGGGGAYTANPAPSSTGYAASLPSAPPSDDLARFSTVLADLAAILPNHSPDTILSCLAQTDGNVPQAVDLLLSTNEQPSPSDSSDSWFLLPSPLAGNS